MRGRAQEKIYIDIDIVQYLIMKTMEHLECFELCLRMEAGWPGKWVENTSII